MKTNETVRILCGAAVVYVVMAACSGGTDRPPAGTQAGHAGSGGGASLAGNTGSGGSFAQGGSIGAGGVPSLGGNPGTGGMPSNLDGAAGGRPVYADGATGGGSLLDVLTNPVPEAAAALPPDVATENCTTKVTSGSTEYFFAVHNYPGKLVNDLARLQVVGHLAPGGPSTFPGGFTNMQSSAYYAHRERLFRRIVITRIGAS